MTAASDLEQLYDRHAQALFGFLLNLTRSEPDTRDLLQELFCRLAAQPGQRIGVRDERAFLLRMAHNLWVDRIRRHSTRERVRATLVEESDEVGCPRPSP